MASQLKIDIIAGIDKLSAALKDVEGKFGALGDKLKNVGSTLSVAVTAPLVAIGAVAANEFATVEKGLREINSHALPPLPGNHTKPIGTQKRT